MAGITLPIAQAQFDTWLAANTAIAAGQSFEMGDRKLTRANLGDVQRQLEFWNQQIQRLSQGGMRAHRLMYTDG